MSIHPPTSFQGDWVTEIDSDYSTSIARWAANAVRPAKAVAFVKNARDVALVLSYAQEKKLPIAIRGGGNSAAGASSTDGGIVIDLSRHLHSVTVDPAMKLAYVGGGAVWETVDKTAIEHGLATVGGTVNHMGVGGLLLGGGQGYLTGQHGLVLDNLVQATVVTANGEILTASDTENPDLFWGIRGAGSNFGVVTEFVLKLHPQRRTVFGGLVVYHANSLESLMTTLTKWYKNGLQEREALFHGFTQCPDGKPMNILILFWNGSAEEGREHFKEFFDIGPLRDFCQELPYEKMNSLRNGGRAHQKNYYTKGVFTSGPLSDCAQQMMDYVTELSQQLEISLTFMFEYLPTKKVLSVPNGETCHIRGDRVSCVAFATWDADKTPKGDLNSTLTKLVDILATSEKTLPFASNTGYANYIMEDPAYQPSSGSRVGANILFARNYPRLQELKRKYDPNRVFTKWCPINV
ncbi:FAD-binding domain-containing protein [Crucibulum laeve]|uniref:FAD-binding domain-containing protein n=1 Tax=Crucibulum laeve TaxID=68775 RepID=A0A5C3LG86_9AGAR|nr:FAD-binding domain-containing protein [Crucibulum laeve]